MKKRVSLSVLVLISLLSYLPLGFAREASLEGLPALPAEDNSTLNPFSLTVTGDGRLLTNPGPLFTEGGDYKDILLPYLVSTPTPIPYPRWAVRQGWEGRFSLAIEILEDGTVGRTKIMQSTRHRLLDQVAEKAVRGWKFHPATKDGQPIVTCIQIPIDFQLERE